MRAFRDRQKTSATAEPATGGGVGGSGGAAPADLGDPLPSANGPGTSAVNRSSVAIRTAVRADAAQETTKAPATRGALLEARGVYRSFGRTEALRGADLAVPAGGSLAVMGPSGSGKSTLLHCLAGIFTPDRGEVWFDGRRLDTLSDAHRTRLRRTAFGFVFQFGQLVPELTAADNIAMPLLLGRVGRAEAYRRAAAWMDRLDLDGLGGRRTGELSGGQAQRVAIGRALVTRPRVLFADEPTGSLDSLTGERVMELLVGAVREEGASLVLVTHDARVAAYADRLVMVRDGRVSSPPGPGDPAGPGARFRPLGEARADNGAQANTDARVTAAADHDDEQAAGQGTGGGR